MTTKRTTDLELAELRERLADLDAELDRMPAFKRFTDWHLSRVRAREFLQRAISRQESQGNEQV